MWPAGDELLILYGEQKAAAALAMDYGYAPAEVAGAAEHDHTVVLIACS